MRKLSVNALLVFCADAGARVLGFFANAYLARTLGQDGFGMTVIGFAFLSYALWFADLGLGTLGTREVGRSPQNREFSPGQILVTRLLLSVVVLVLAQGAAMLLYADAALRWTIAGFLLCVLAYAVSIEWYYLGLRRYPPLVVSRILVSALYLGAVSLFVQDAGDVAQVPLYYLLATLLPALMLFLIPREKGALSPQGWSIGAAAGILRRSGYIGLGGVFAQSVQLLPPLVLGYFYSSESVGLLGAALRVMSILLVVDRIFAALFLPAISRQWSTRREEALAGLQHLTALIIVTGAALATVTTIYARPLIVLIFGGEYSGGAGVLAVLGWFAAATLANSVFSFGLIGTGNERGYLRAASIGGIFSVLITVALIYWWGLPGAAAAMVASELVIVALTWREFRREAPVRFLRPLLVAVAVSAALLGGGWWLGAGSLWWAPVAGLLFLLLAFLLGGIRREDIIWLARR